MLLWINIQDKEYLLFLITYIGKDMRALSTFQIIPHPFFNIVRLIF
jgi:hypothetical protein